MANARLHLICGNCGCNDEWGFKYDPECIYNGYGEFIPEVYLYCKNCGTLHNLSDNADMESE